MTGAAADPPAPSVGRTALRDLGGWARRERIPVIGGVGLLGLVVVGASGSAGLQSTAASALYLLLAVYALQLLARETAQPSLGQAAFLAFGAYVTAFLRLRAGLDGLLAALLSAPLAAAAGWAMGWGASRLGPPILGLLTWVFGWLVYVALAAFPQVTGGGAGIAFRAAVHVRVDALGIDFRMSAFDHVLLGAGLLALFLVLYRSAQQSVIGRAWAALRDSRSLAASLGCDVPAMRRGAFAASAGVAALAGGLGAELLSVVDPTRFSPVHSLTLYAAVLIGAPLGFFGPVLGAALAGGAPFAVDQVSQLTGFPLAPARELVAAALILAALAVSARLTRPQQVTGAPRRAGHPHLSATTPAPSPRRGGEQAQGRAILEGTGITIHFDGVLALDDVAITVTEGEVRGLIGPNGSGKSTLLRCLSGTLMPQYGSVSLAGQNIHPLGEPARVHAGLVRTFQRTAVMPHLPAGDHVLVGARVRQQNAGWLQALCKTPAYRAGEAEARRLAADMLEVFGLGAESTQLPETLSAGRQRLLQIATAAATGPRVMLLDEPSAGMSGDEGALLHRAIVSLAARGVGLLVIEHNMAFLAGLASQVTVLDGGRVVAVGTPAEVAADAGVRRAYLGAHFAELSEASGAPRGGRRRAPRRPAG